MTAYPHLSRDVPRHPIVPSVLTKLSHVRLPSPIPGCPQISYGTWCALQVVPCPLTLTYPGMSPDILWYLVSTLCAHQVVPCPLTLTYPGMSPDILWYLVCLPSCPMSAYPHLSRDVPRHPMVPCVLTKLSHVRRHPMVPGVLTKLSHVRLPSPIPGCPQTSYGTLCAHQVVPCPQTSYGTWCAYQVVPCPLTLTYPGMSPDILWYLVCSPSCPMSAYPHLHVSRDVPRHPMVPGVLTKLSHVRLPSPIQGCPQTSYGTWCAHQVVPCLLILTLCPRTFLTTS